MRNFKLRDAAVCAALTLAAVAVCMAPSDSMAADEEENVNTRASFYALAGGSYTPDENFSSSTPLGFNVRAGARFNRWFAIEAQLDWFKNDGEGHNPYMVGGNTKVYPLAGPIQPYVIAGVGAFTINNDARAMGRVGGGVEYYVTENIGVMLEATYMHAITSSLDYPVVSWGLAYRN